jgi:hypothetical protein
MLQRIDDDSHVAGPRDHVTSVHGFHADKILVTRIYIERAHIRILKSRIGIDLMNKMGAVLRSIRGPFGLPSCVHNGASFFAAQ